LSKPGIAALREGGDGVKTRQEYQWQPIIP